MNHLQITQHLKDSLLDILLSRMDRWLPPDLVDFIHSINITQHHTTLMLDIQDNVTHHLTAFEQYKGRRLETYCLIIQCGDQYKYCMYSNGPSESKDMNWCLLHAYTVIKNHKTLTNRSTMVLNIPIENRTVTHCG